MVLRSSFLLITVIAVCIAGFGQQAASTSKPQSSSPAVILTQQDNGRDIDLVVGGTLIVKLPSNPSTGYNWTVAGEPSPLKLQKARFRKGQAKANTVGASGTSVFQFSAGSSGLATLTLVYRRSWEYNVLPIQTFAARVDVR